jgi:hypothetical protein
VATVTRWVVSLLSSVLLCGGLSQAVAQLPAFPGAQGFGSTSRGGRGGMVLHVNTLSDSGPGSFRDAVLTAGPRTIVFDISGNIDCRGGSGSADTMYVTQGQVTIAGQTAPGQGVTLMCGVIFEASDIVVRHIRFRPGRAGPGTRHPNDDPGSMSGTQIVGPATGVIFDHVTVSWASDELVAIVTNAEATIQWSIVAEPLTDGGKGLWQGHGFAGGSYDSPSANKATFHHGLIAYASDRNPFVAGSWFQWENMIIYDYEVQANLAPINQPITAQAIGNYYLPGADTPAWGPPIWIWGCGGQVTHCDYPAQSSIYVAGNLEPANRPDNSRPETAILTYFQGGFPVRDTRQPGFPVITTTDAATAKSQVLACAGATMPARDSVDTRVTQQVAQGTGRFVSNDPSEVGGYPDLPVVRRPVGYDTDGDGIPDAWEKAHGLNPLSASDGAAVTADGYTNLEHYLQDAAGDTTPQAAGSLCPTAPPAMGQLPPPRNLRGGG